MLVQLPKIQSLRSKSESEELVSPSATTAGMPMPMFSIVAILEVGKSSQYDFTGQLQYKSSKNLCKHDSHLQCASCFKRPHTQELLYSLKMEVHICVFYFTDLQVILHVASLKTKVGGKWEYSM